MIIFKVHIKLPTAEPPQDPKGLKKRSLKSKEIFYHRISDYHCFSACKVNTTLLTTSWVFRASICRDQNPRMTQKHRYFPKISWHAILLTQTWCLVSFPLNHTKVFHWDDATEHVAKLPLFETITRIILSNIFFF